jgi:hypothetical protein
MSQQQGVASQLAECSVTRIAGRCLQPQASRRINRHPASDERHPEATTIVSAEVAQASAFGDKP